VIYLDPSAQTSKIIAQVEADENPLDLIEGIDAANFDNRQLELLSYVLRRNYSQVRVHEITAFSEDDEPMPFFEVTSLGKTYSLVGMGRGELSAAYLLWRLTLADPGTVVLLEEPESHLASYSQSALADAIVSLVIDRDLTIVTSSHSPGLFERLPDTHTVLLTSSPRPEIRGNLGTTELARHLGLSMATQAMVVLEDVVAGELMISLMSRVDRVLISTVSVKYAKSGESGVARVASELVDVAKVETLPVLGVLDGDQRSGKGYNSSSAIFGYLPGSVAPEVLLREALNGWRDGDYSDWEPSLPGGSARMRMELERLDGFDHHDWLHDLGVAYGGRSKVVECIAGLLLKNSEVLEQAKGLAGWIRGRLGITTT